MKKTVLLIFVSLAVSYPAIAKQRHHHREHSATSHSRITCEMVRAYVAQVGLVQAKSMAQAAGITESENEKPCSAWRRKSNALPAAIDPPALGQ